MTYRRSGTSAIFDYTDLHNTSPYVVMPDSMIYDLVDGKIEYVVWLFDDGRYWSTLDDWLAQPSKEGWRRMSLTMMDRG